MSAEIRKIVHYRETTLVEGFKSAAKPWQQFAVAAVISNPWAGRFVENLTEEIKRSAPGLGELLTNEICELAGGAENIEAYGKAAVVGGLGEIEHGSGMIHTLRFGNYYRQALDAKSYLSFTNTRGGENAAIMIPMMHIHDLGKRSHYLTLQFSIPDAPRQDEMVVALGGASSGRPHHRIGDRYQDLKEMGNDVDNPAAV
ncbi:MAG: amino acid synthesis family protein [Pseudomonadota bacterium]